MERLAAASRYPGCHSVTAYTGLRWGEVTGIRLRNVDLKRRRVLIEENAVEVNGHVQVGTPKTARRRAVVYPAFLDKAGARRRRGRRPTICSGQLGVWGIPSAGQRRLGWFAGAVKRIRAEDAKAATEAKERGGSAADHAARDLTTCATRPLRSRSVPGRTSRPFQRLPGHASAAMTLDTYAELFEDDLDRSRWPSTVSGRRHWGRRRSLECEMGATTFALNSIGLPLAC